MQKLDLTEEEYKVLIIALNEFETKYSLDGYQQYSNLAKAANKANLKIKKAFKNETRRILHPRITTISEQTIQQD